MLLNRQSFLAKLRNFFVFHLEECNSVKHLVAFVSSLYGLEAFLLFKLSYLRSARLLKDRPWDNMDIGYIGTKSTIHFRNTRFIVTFKQYKNYKKINLQNFLIVTNVVSEKVQDHCKFG